MQWAEAVAQGDRPSLPLGQVAIHDHCHLPQHAAARLQRLQSCIDRLDGAVGIL
jgi:hypothetical protein